MTQEADFQDAVAKAVAAEIVRLQKAGSLNPAGTVPNRQHAGNYEFDPTTKRILNSHLTRQLWRPDNLRSCPCGRDKWAHVQEYMGEREITTAMRPVVNLKTGQIVQMPHQDAFALYDEVGRPNLDTCLIPDDLRLTPEKAAHMRECQKIRHEGLESAGDLEEVDTSEAANVLRMVSRGS